MMSSGKRSMGKKGSIRISNNSKDYGFLDGQNRDPKWSIHATNFKPAKTVSDQELDKAKKLFWDLDRDSSGSIESDELAFCLRALGQNPTKEGIKRLIAMYDDGEKDGKIQLREFLKMYSEGLDTQNSAGQEDVHDTFRAVGGCTEEAPEVAKEAISEYMQTNFQLDVDVDQLFDSFSDKTLQVKHFEKLLMS